MEKLEQLLESYQWLLFLIIILAVWESVWKLIALWKSAGKKQLAWFICIAVFNTLGILPIIYLLLNRKASPVQD